MRDDATDERDDAVAVEALRRLLPDDQLRPLMDAERLQVDGEVLSAESVIAILAPYLTEDRIERIEAVLAARTYGIAPVVEGLTNVGNVSAVMRTAEGLGFQPFHVVTGADRYKLSRRTSQGAEKWLDVRTWESPSACAAYLKAEGYQIVATHLDAAVPISEVDFTRPTALVFGNERDGVSREMLAASDQRCIIPIPGFVQSFNISVAAAVGLYHAYRERERQGDGGDLTTAERARLRADFYMRSVQHAPNILRRHRRERG